MWFIGILAALGLLGFLFAVVAMFPLAMATDVCHEGSTEKVCELSATGQNVLVMIPWGCLFAGVCGAVAGAGIAARFRWTPLLGIPVGLAVYFAMIPVGYAIALHT